MSSAQASLRLCSGAAQPRLRVKQRLLRVEALTGAGRKKVLCQTMEVSVGGIHSSVDTSGELWSQLQRDLTYLWRPLPFGRIRICGAVTTDHLPRTDVPPGSRRTYSHLPLKLSQCGQQTGTPSNQPPNFKLVYCPSSVDPFSFLPTSSISRRMRSIESPAPLRLRMRPIAQ